MVDLEKCLIIFCSVTLCSAGVCYRDNGHSKKNIVICPAGCCKSGDNPCCSFTDSGPILLFPLVAGIISLGLILVCALVLCMQRKSSRSKTMARQQQQTKEKQTEQTKELSDLYMASNQYHIVVFNANRSRNVIEQLELPPRYSDIYPEKPKTSISDETVSLGGRGLGFWGSLKRPSFFRRSGRNRQDSQNALTTSNQTTELKIKGTESKSSEIQEPTKCSASVKQCDSVFTDCVTDIDLSDATGLMASISGDLPEVFENSQNR